MLTFDESDNHGLHKEHPCLVAEVLSASTETIDRREKLNVYQTISSLRYILLIRSNYADVEYFCRNDDGEWKTAKLQGDDLLGIECRGYRTTLGLIDIYEGVVFPE